MTDCDPPIRKKSLRQQLFATPTQHTIDALMSAAVVNADSSSSESGDDERARIVIDQYQPDADSDVEDQTLRVQARAQRKRMEESVRRRPIMWCGLAFSVIGIVLIGIGIIEVSLAESERKHGWQLTTCLIETNYGANDTNCIYFSVTANVPQYDTNKLCAVAGALAEEAWFFEPPACSHLDRADAVEVEYWSRLGRIQVECYVPVERALSADACVHSVVTHGVSSALWRSWIDRFVYVVRRPREGATAIERVTAPRLNAGIMLSIAGALTVGVGMLFLCERVFSSLIYFCCASPTRVQRYYRRRHTAAHKIS